MFGARRRFISIQYVFHSLKLGSSTQSVSQRNIGSQNCDKNKISAKTLRGEKNPPFSANWTLEDPFFSKFGNLSSAIASEVLGVRSWDRNMFYTYHGSLFGEKGAPQYLHPPGTILVEKLTKMDFQKRNFRKLLLIRVPYGCTYFWRALGKIKL